MEFREQHCEEKKKEVSNGECEMHSPAGFTASTPTFDSEVAQCFYSWREMYPELKLLLDNIDVIKREAAIIGQVTNFC